MRFITEYWLILLDSPEHFGGWNILTGQNADNPRHRFGPGCIYSFYPGMRVICPSSAGKYHSRERKVIRIFQLTSKFLQHHIFICRIVFCPVGSFLSAHNCCRFEYRLVHTVHPHASTKYAIQSAFNFWQGRGVIFIQKCFGSHQCSRCTIPALKDSIFDYCLN
ncbi:MAG: hypothetical protein ACD_34C00198G0004 [uncultured bacterium]|nr:MAG: hypothetical protein ACD_34C00198G0004 [uncultured bacterium]